MADTRQQLQTAHKLIKAKRKAEARDILVEILQEDETVIDAYWLWSLAAETADEAVEALEEVLRLDPQHSRAKKRIEQIKARQKKPQEATPFASADAPKPRPKRKKSGNSPVLSFMIGAIFIIFMGTVALLISTQIQIGPCPAKEWLEDYRQVTIGLDAQLSRLVSAASMGNTEVMEATIEILEDYKSDIKKLYGSPCVRSAGDKTRSYISAVIAYAEAVGGSASEKVRDKAKETMDKKKSDLNKKLRELAEIAASQE